MRIVYIGTGDIGLPTLELLLKTEEHHVLAVVTQPDKPAGRGLEMKAPPIKDLAMRHHVPIFQPAKIRDQHSIEQILYLRPDVIVVMAYGQILPGAVLRAGRIACLNLHASLLPRHRGAAPIQAAIQSGDRESGITVMFMDEGLDTGDILLAKKIPIRRRETGGSLHERLAVLAPEAIAEALALLKKGQAPRVPQNSAAATYAKKLTRENGEINWSATPSEIDRLIRAMNPWPGAYTWLPAEGGTAKKFKIFTIIQSSRRSGSPGEIIRADKHGILVASKNGSVLIREVQLEGKKRMTAREFLLGNPVNTGTVLGRT
jgi:methionyl-tRNA formyltransferase